MSEPNDFSPPATQPSALARFVAMRVPLWLALLVAVVLLVALGWQQIAMGRAEARLAAERAALAQRFEADRQALLNELKAKVEANADEAQRRFGLALAWAVRDAMIRNNLDQVDQYFTEIVRLPQVERAVLADSGGTVRVSTDRRHLGAALTTLVPVEATLADAVAVRTSPEGPKLLVVPVMGLNSRLGTVVVSYRQADVLGGN